MEKLTILRFFYPLLLSPFFPSSLALIFFHFISCNVFSSLFSHFLFNSLPFPFQLSTHFILYLSVLTAINAVAIHLCEATNARTDKKFVSRTLKRRLLLHHPPLITQSHQYIYLAIIYVGSLWPKVDKKMRNEKCLREAVQSRTNK